MDPTYTMAQIQAMSAKLRGLPPVDTSQQTYGKFEAVYLLAKDLVRLIRRGYTTRALSDILREEGVTISPTMLELNLLPRQSLVKETFDVREDNPNI